MREIIEGIIQRIEMRIKNLNDDVRDEIVSFNARRAERQKQISFLEDIKENTERRLLEAVKDGENAI